MTVIVAFLNGGGGLGVGTSIPKLDISTSMCGAVYNVRTCQHFLLFAVAYRIYMLLKFVCSRQQYDREWFFFWN